MRGARVGEESTFGRAKGLCIGLVLGMKLSLPSSVAAVKSRRRNLSALPVYPSHFFLETRRAYLAIVPVASVAQAPTAEATEYR